MNTHQPLQVHRAAVHSGKTIDQLLAHRLVAVTAMHDAARATQRLPSGSEAGREWQAIKDACVREVARTDFYLTGPRRPVQL